MITLFSGAKQTIGFNTHPLGYFFDVHKKYVTDGVNHEIDRNHTLIQHITHLSALQPKIYPTENDIDKVQPYLTPPYITISHGSVWATKKLPLHHWISFIHQLQPHIKVYLLGSKAEYVEGNLIAASTPQHTVVNLCGQLGLVPSGVLMLHAVMNYCNDSAPLHIASAMNAPITCIFTSTSPRFGFGPLSSHGHIVETTMPLACKPCTNHGKKECPQKHFLCAQSIRTEQLLNTLPQHVKL